MGMQDDDQLSAKACDPRNAFRTEDAPDEVVALFQSALDDLAGGDHPKNAG